MVRISTYTFMINNNVHITTTNIFFYIGVVIWFELITLSKY